MSPGPLSDLLIVDLSRVLAGPCATTVPSDLGARVIKVEVPGIGHTGEISGFGDPAVRLNAPALDEHRAAILAELGLG